MIRRRFLVALLLLAACGGGGTQGVSPAASARETVGQFLQAAADSNETRMAQLWGSSSGPAATTRQPADWERRIAIMRAYLQGTTHRILTESAGPGSGRHTVQVELARGSCTYVVPIVAARTGSGWVVNDINLDLVGTPGRDCGQPAAE